MWTREKVAKLEVVNGVLQTTGIEGRRHCGCSYIVGIRMDDHEPTFGVTPCDEHGGQARRVLLMLQTMPPSDESIEDLFTRSLDYEIEPWKTAETA